MRFPKSYFRTTSQGELVSMVTSESEPMGGLMGDAVAQPVFQAGQMLTIVVFLFAQSVWFGLASIALIPLQAWLIPMLQRQINLLNKSRIQELRQLSAEIGETAQGASDLRENGGWYYRQAQISDRLSKLFGIRFNIYQKKFFMKFLNNFITQLTPFFFYAVGGILAIRGEITVGALVAALAAYKDLSGPWKELLTYYNQVQDMSLRWQIVMERFDPQGIVPETLFEGRPDSLPHLRGEIAFKDVTVRDGDGNTILEDITLTIPPKARVAIKSGRPSERAAMAQLLTRELVPVRGEITLSGHKMNELHQAVIAARVGSAHSRPTIFNGTIGDNILMPLRTEPQEAQADDTYQREALASGNMADPIGVNWVNADVAGLSDIRDVKEWWFRLVQAMGLDEGMFNRILHNLLDPRVHPQLAKDVVALRPEIHATLVERDLDHLVNRFDPDVFNPSVPLGGNLLYAAPIEDMSTERLSQERQFIQLLDDLGISEELDEVSRSILETLSQTFGRGGTEHPLFRRLGLEPERYLKMMDLLAKREQYGALALSEEEHALLMTTPFVLTAEQIGPAFPDTLKKRILDIRRENGPALRASLEGKFISISPDAYLPRLTVLENLLFGRVSMMAGSKQEEIIALISEIVNRHQLRSRLSALVYDIKAGLGGANLPTTIQERLAFSRAGIKRPDILIMDHVLASHDAAARARARIQLRDLLPDSIMIFMEDDFNSPENYDLFVEIKDGRIDGVDRAEDVSGDSDATADLRRKLSAIGDVELFAGLSRRNQRLLAFSSKWYTVQENETIFDIGEQADAVYLCVKGRAELRFEGHGEADAPISTIEPGRIIGDLAVIMGEVRSLRLVATEPSTFLRIGSEEFTAVIESDASVALSLLQTVAGYLTNTALLMRELRDSEAGRETINRLLNERDEENVTDETA